MYDHNRNNNNKNLYNNMKGGRTNKKNEDKQLNITFKKYETNKIENKVQTKRLSNNNMGRNGSILFWMPIIPEHFFIRCFQIFVFVVDVVWYVVWRGGINISVGKNLLCCSQAKITNI